MNKKILYGFLPIFLSLVVMLMPMKSVAAPSDYEDVLDWDGTVTFANNYINSPLHCVLVDYKKYTNNDLVTNANAVYAGKSSNIMTIEGLVPGSVITGKLVVFGSVTKPVDTNTAIFYDPFITFDADNEGNIIFGGYTRSLSGRTVNFSIEVQFNDYYCTNDFVNIPFEIGLEIGVRYKNIDTTGIDAVMSHVGSFMPGVTVSYASDWAGDMYMYTNPQSNPSMDGYFAEQNQQIIDNSQTQINNQQTIIQDIQNQTNQQHQDSQAQINQSIQNTDQITNGYNSGLMGEAEDKFSSGAGDLTDIEDSLTDSSSGYVNSFTSTGFDTSFLQSIGPSLNYVVTWFTNFWNMGGALTSTYGLSFAIFIAFYILRVRG